jgi:sulfhydrogenase subunit alpha
MTVKTIKVDYLARVEGEGAIKVVVRDGAVESAEFRIFEPSRFFAWPRLHRGARHYAEESSHRAADLAEPGEH